MEKVELVFPRSPTERESLMEKVELLFPRSPTERERLMRKTIRKEKAEESKNVWNIICIILYSRNIFKYKNHSIQKLVDKTLNMLNLDKETGI